MKIELSCITTTLLLKLMFVIQSNAASIGDTTLSNSVISDYRIQPKDLSAEKGLKLIKHLKFVSKDDLNGNDTVSVELHPNDDFALERCRPKALLYELLNFQLQLYLSIEKTTFRPDLFPVCERVEKCVGSMHAIASRSEAFEERFFSPIFLVLKQAVKLACNLERKESKMNVNTIVDTTQTAYNQFMMLKNLIKTVMEVNLF